MTPISAIATKKEQGFTLIELVMVIVILGILAAFALPRFADLGSDARLATLQGAEASAKSAAAIAHSKWLAQGSPTASGTTPVSITLEGTTTITMTNEGYPTDDNAGIGTAAQLTDDFNVNEGTVSALDSDGNALTDCNFTYSETTGLTTDGATGGC